MNEFKDSFTDPQRIQQYIEKGPPAFIPGHTGLMQMIGVLLSERVPSEGEILVIGAGGGLEIRYLASVEKGWRFVGVDPAAPMLNLAHAIAGELAGNRMRLIQGTISDAPQGPFDGATCILVLGLVPDDGSKLDLLRQCHQRLRPSAPFVLVDQCLDRTAADFEVRLDRYAAYARRSGVDHESVADARRMVGALQSIVPAQRNETLLAQAGFSEVEIFYTAMAWRGWIAYA